MYVCVQVRMVVCVRDCMYAVIMCVHACVKSCMHVRLCVCVCVCLHERGSPRVCSCRKCVRAWEQCARQRTGGAGRVLALHLGDLTEGAQKHWGDSWGMQAWNVHKGIRAIALRMYESGDFWGM